MRTREECFLSLRKAEKKGKNLPKQFLPKAVPCVDLAIIQVVLLAGVEHKLSFMGAIFLQKTRRGSERAAVTDNSSGYSGESETVFMSVDKGRCEL